MIVVAGEALIDRIQDGSGAVREVPGGSPFNTARALARLGAPVSFLGHLSTDAHGQRLKDALVAAGVDVALVSSGPEPTTVAIAVLGQDGEARYRFATGGTAAPALTAEAVPSGFGDGVGAFLVGSLGLALEPIATTLTRLVKRVHGRSAIVLDPNVRAGAGDAAAHRARLRSIAAVAAVVKASAADLAFIEPRLAVDAAARRLLDRGARVVVVTLGAQGAFAVHGRSRVDVDALPVDVVDTIGAGDVFGAALVAWLHRHDRLRADVSLSEEELAGALGHAAAAAALACAHGGAYAPTAEEVAVAENRRLL